MSAGAGEEAASFLQVRASQGLLGNLSEQEVYVQVQRLDTCYTPRVGSCEKVEESFFTAALVCGCVYE